MAVFVVLPSAWDGVDRSAEALNAARLTASQAEGHARPWAEFVARRGAELLGGL